MVQLTVYAPFSCCCRTHAPAHPPFHGSEVEVCTRGCASMRIPKALAAVAGRHRAVELSHKRRRAACNVRRGRQRPLNERALAGTFTTAPKTAINMAARESNIAASILVRLLEPPFEVQMPPCQRSLIYHTKNKRSFSQQNDEYISHFYHLMEDRQQDWWKIFRLVRIGKLPDFFTRMKGL